ncbi:hypothetical protein BCR32DRAFT_245336 [Anaeromyces robustus]|uniref:DUF1753-domain-containing protein n=1 Tax=Anaeromyces robustus TaxID=1754192 RepID=A0A1Y1X623_9FUNG|nr:hypothetical protein BCR32DRAFT_245336 [Anaeromyces robustus]|eukprot:ORX80826.1 hypothetical protein BCR32DRAFT_245336 [Anaeromyces robustus]
MKIFEDKSKFFFLYFLPDNVAAIISAIFMFKKVIPLYIFSTLYTVYLFISCCYYYYNFVTLILSGTYRTYYNAYDYLTDLYFEDHPELDYYTEYTNIRSKLKTQFYLESFCHLFVIILMIYYNYVLTEFIDKKQLEYSDELGDNKLFENSKLQGTIKTSNISLNTSSIQTSNNINSN